MASLVKAYTKEKLTGQIFTPFYIVEKILDDVNYTTEAILGKTILDPACGDGRFLLKIAERILKHSKPESRVGDLLQIYGWDIDAKAVEQAKQKLNKLIEPYKIKVNWNVKVKNSIYETQKAKQKFDYIVGNPPYIRIQHLDIEDRQYIQKNYQFCKSGSTDIYIAFYELALNLLRKNGICGYITPNTFFHTETAKGLRKHFEINKNLIQITNYGAIQLFEDATTYSAICVFGKQKKQQFLYQLAKSKTELKERFINFKEIENQIFWQLSLLKVKKKAGKRLGDFTNIHVGLTTLADRIYILAFVKKEGKYIFLQTKSKEIIKFETEILKPIVKISTLKKTNEPIKEYILFPYKMENNTRAILPEDELKKKYPLAYQYLLDNKKILDKRDNGKPNKIAWYAYGRSQGLITSFGKKIVFSPMNKKPKFMFHENEKATFYSGYCIKYQGDNNKLLEQLNSERMEDYISVSARDFRGGWKAYNKKIVQEFIIHE